MYFVLGEGKPRMRDRKSQVSLNRCTTNARRIQRICGFSLNEHFSHGLSRAVGVGGDLRRAGRLAGHAGHIVQTGNRTHR